MRKRLPLIVMAIIMLAPCMTCSPVFAKSKAKSPALIKSVLVYTVNYRTNKWEKSQKRTFSYKKKYPKKSSVYEYGAKYKTTNTYKYTFRGKVPKKMVLKNSEAISPDVYKYTKHGRISRITTGPDSNGKSTSSFIYGTRNYFTAVLHDHIRIEGNEDGTSEYDYAEELDSVSVTTRKNGLLKKTVNHGLFANYTYAHKRHWDRFYGTYTVNYDKNGIARITSAKFRAFPGSGPQLKFKLFKKNGLIKKVIRYSWDSDAKKGKGAWERSEKYVFKYTSSKINKIRYASMINSQIMDLGNNYYMYNWY